MTIPYKRSQMRGSFPDDRKRKKKKYRTIFVKGRGHVRGFDNDY